MTRKNVIPMGDLDAVFAVPPLARRNDTWRTLDLEANEKIVQHIRAGGIRRLIYGGNAFLYHITLAEYEQLLAWLGGLRKELWCVPSAGPSYGRAMDQAPLLQRHRFPCVMMLPCGDPRDAAGLEQGLREFSDAAETLLMLYCKDETNFGPHREAGLDVIGRLVSDGVCVAVKYAVVRQNPAVDPYLSDLLKRVDRFKVISGIGERPAVVHMRDFGLPGFTTGSGCIAPGLSQALFEACVKRDYPLAMEIREAFLPLEDFRDANGPGRVLHCATALAGIADTGPETPYQSTLTAQELDELRPLAVALVERNATATRNPSESLQAPEPAPPQP